MEDNMAGWSDVAKPVVDMVCKAIDRHRAKKIAEWSKDPEVLNELKAHGFIIDSHGNLVRVQSTDSTPKGD
jgi:hypothetical protein